MIFSPKLLQKSGQRLKGRIDYVGAVLVTASLMLLVYGIVSAEHSGWTSSNVMISLIAGVVLFLIFLLVESKMKEALLPLNIFKTPDLGIGNIGVFLTQAAWFPLIYVDSLSAASVTLLSDSRRNGSIACAIIYGILHDRRS